MHGGVPAHGYEPDAADLFGQPYYGDAYSAMATELGRDDLASPQLGQAWPNGVGPAAGAGPVSDLTRGGVFGPRPDPHPELLAMETTREPQAVPDGPELVPVFLTSGIGTSAGPGPGVKYLPPREANALISPGTRSAGTTRPGALTTAARPARRSA